MRYNFGTIIVYEMYESELLFQKNKQNLKNKVYGQAN